MNAATLLKFNEVVDIVITLIDSTKKRGELWDEDEHYFVIKSIIKFSYAAEDIQINLLKIQEHPRFNPLHRPFLQYMFALSCRYTVNDN